MLDQRRIKKEMLHNPIDIQIDSSSANSDIARSIADAVAQSKGPNPMLLAWFDAKKWKHSPAIVCGCGERPSWLVYAQTRGGTISIYINEGEYVFIYRNPTIDSCD